MSELFSFPNPVNETSARTVAAVVAALAVCAVAFQQGWLLPVLAYGFVARASTVGGVFTVVATVLWFAVGRKAFFLGIRIGLVPPSVCEACARA